MDWFSPHYRRDPNQKVESLYSGVGMGNSTVTRLVTRHPTQDRMQTTITRGQGLARGQGGQIGVLVLGGMETTLDEMEYLIEARKQKPFVPRKSTGEIVQMCYELLERRNSLIRHLKKNPSEVPRKPRPVLLLPVGCRMVRTSEPGLKVLTKV